MSDARVLHEVPSPFEASNGKADTFKIEDISKTSKWKKVKQLLIKNNKPKALTPITKNIILEPNPIILEQVLVPEIQTVEMLSHASPVSISDLGYHEVILKKRPKIKVLKTKNLGKKNKRLIPVDNEDLNLPIYGPQNQFILPSKSQNHGKNVGYENFPFKDELTIVENDGSRSSNLGYNLRYQPNNVRTNEFIENDSIEINKRNQLVYMQNAIKEPQNSI